MEHGANTDKNVFGPFRVESVFHPWLLGGESDVGP